MAETENKLIFEYTRCEAGWLDFSISFNETKLDYTFSYVFDDPKYLIEWAEEIFTGKYSEYASHAEGWCWFLNYDGKYLSVSDTRDYNDEKYLRFKTEISKDELCRVLYKAVKTFQKSGLYNPREWEPLIFKDLLVKAYGNSDEILDTLKTLSKKQILTELKKRYVPDIYGIENFCFFYTNEYDEADISERKSILEETVEDTSDHLGYGGWPVMEIKSQVLEQLL